MLHGLPTTKSEVDDNKCQDYQMIYSRLKPAERSDWIKNAGGKGGAMRLARLGNRWQVNLWHAISRTYFGCWWYE
jgi:hypothetical protein